MNHCYCGRKISQKYARKLDFEITGDDITYGICDNPEAMFDYEAYVYDVGLDIFFCSEECIDDFVYDYVNYLMESDKRIRTYKYVFRHGYWRKERDAYLHLYLLDENKNIINRFDSRGCLIGYDKFDKDAIKEVINMKLEEDFKEKCYCRHKDLKKEDIESGKYYDYDIGVGINFCSDSCVHHLAEDYPKYIRRVIPEITTYTEIFEKGDYKNLIPAKLYLYLLDSKGNVVFKIASRYCNDSFYKFNKNVIKTLHRRKRIERHYMY